MNPALNKSRDKGRGWDLEMYHVGILIFNVCVALVLSRCVQVHGLVRSCVGETETCRSSSLEFHPASTFFSFFSDDITWQIAVIFTSILTS